MVKGTSQLGAPATRVGLRPCQAAGEPGRARCGSRESDGLTDGVLF